MVAVTVNVSTVKMWPRAAIHSYSDSSATAYACGKYGALALGQMVPATITRMPSDRNAKEKA
jgi:hypothetical protein